MKPSWRGDLDDSWISTGRVVREGAGMAQKLENPAGAGDIYRRHILDSINTSTDLLNNKITRLE